MACFYPVQAWRNRVGDVVFKAGQGVGLSFRVPCGQCIGCRLERARQWAVRIVHECSLYSHSCFVTLTYADDNLPSDRGLRKRDFQLFMKRLRQARRREASKRLGRPWKRLPDAEKKLAEVRYFHCGEYGETNGRPHYHAVLFGVDFADRREVLQGPGANPLYISAQLDRLWGHGQCIIGAVTFESASYVARYCVKKISGDGAQSVTGDGVPGRYMSVDRETGEIVAIEPEYVTCSLKPGIGARWYERYEGDFRGRDVCVIRGVETKIPRYYDTLFGRKDEAALEAVRVFRIRKMSSKQADNTPGRLAVREKVVRGKLNLKGRS